MARFTNYATLSYQGGTKESNTVTGELLEVLSATKTALQGDYSAGDRVGYVISLVNSGTTALTEVSVSDDLGGYAFGEETLTPLSYVNGSVRLYVNGTLAASPTVTAGAPVVFGGITVPAGGNALLIYEADVTVYAPLGAEATVTNTATVTGGGLGTPITATATIANQVRAELSISKGICPATVTENGTLTYTFVIENSGTAPADAAEEIILTDTFSPILNPIAVTLNGTAWTAGTEYTYDATTGVFASTAGAITVPAATVAQAANGTWVVTPGTATVVITGTV